MELAIKLKNIQQSFGAKEVLNIPELAIYQNDRIGIIGDNGTGKSTLLRLLKGNLAPDAGEVQRKIDFRYYPQQAPLPKNVADLDGELSSRLALPNHLEGLSGGEQSKFRLAEILSTYELGLLLDEPTTHLDEAGVELLVEELRYYYGTLVFVSHDRRLLNQLATKIWEVAEGGVTVYSGNYDAYREQKESHTLALVKAGEQYQKEKQRLETAIEKKKAQAIKANQLSAKKRKKNIRPDRLSSSKQKDTVQKNLQKTAKALASRLDQLEAPGAQSRQRKIHFPSSQTLTLHNKYPLSGTNFTLQKGNKLLLDRCDFQFSLGEKIALVGDNGVGKTSFLQALIAGDEHLIRSPKVVFSVYQQLAYKLKGTEVLLEYLMKETDYPEKLVRSILHNLGFSQIEINKPISVLSGGEATRLQLARVFVRPANILVLDEPTNFIDLSTIETLEELIRAYPGTVLFTSHDRAFVEQVATKIYKLKDQRLLEVL